MHNTLINANTNLNYRRTISQNQQQQQQQQQSHQENQYKSKLFDEISILMRAFGDTCDAHMQIRESVILVEKILIQQLKNIIDLALEINPSGPQLKDYEFLLQKNKPKQIRFRKYIKNIQKIQSKQGEQNSNFLNRISSTEESDEEEIYDAEKTRRIYRADRISQILSPQKYEEYQKARSFTSNIRNKMNFLNKLIEMLQVPKEVQDGCPHFSDVILFLAQETIATIVDYSILTRLTSDNRTSEKVIVASNFSNDLLGLCPEVTQGRGQEGIKPIKVQEIQEAMRRCMEMHNQRRMGPSKIAFLAL